MSQACIAVDGTQAQDLRAALRELRSQFGALETSSTWCQREGDTDSLHMAVSCNSILPASELHALLGRIGARTHTRITLLLLGNAVVQDGTIQLPHPELAANTAWLRALASLAPSQQHPGTGRGFAGMADALPDSGLRPWDYNIE